MTDPARLLRADQLKRRVRLVVLAVLVAGGAVYLALGTAVAILAAGLLVIPVAPLQREIARLRPTRSEAVEEASTAGMAMATATAFIAAGVAMIFG